ncbi:MAG: class I SAM-dependent methyltransferase [Clostridia bacterium]|nr:class I SAM-dependent methyltransferase [Clostridia bacterium]
MYSALATVYDLFADDIDYDRWARDIANTIEDNSAFKAKSIVDLACGTGSITCRLAKMGYALTGIDISEEMLFCAGEKMRKTGVSYPLVKQNISSFSLHKRADAIVCACDGINYLLDEKDLNGFFESCRKSLKKGGVLVFDISSEEKLKNTLGNNQYFDIRDEACLFWKNSIDGDFVDMDLNIFIEDEKGKYLRLKESQRQRIYSKEEITKNLNGFELIEIKSVSYDKNNTDKRLQFVCRLSEEL